MFIEMVCEENDVVDMYVNATNVSLKYILHQHSKHAVTIYHGDDNDDSVYTLHLTASSVLYWHAIFHRAAPTRLRHQRFRTGRPSVPLAFKATTTHRCGAPHPTTLAKRLLRMANTACRAIVGPATHLQHVPG